MPEENRKVTPGCGNPECEDGMVPDPDACWKPCPDCVCYAPKHCECNKCLAAFAYLRLPSATAK